MKNKHSTDGIAEDIIRSFVQMMALELHAKTIVEKRLSELDNGLIDLDTQLSSQLQKIEEAKQDVMDFAQLRRDDMLVLFELYGSKGDKEQWCFVKHTGAAMMTAFEAWQASEDDPKLFNLWHQKNRKFISSMTKFLGVELTECAACFADILKGES